MKLYTHSPSPNCIQVMAVAHTLGIPLEEVEMQPHSKECRTPEFLAMNPNGLLPVLQDGSYFLWESNAIVVYLAHKVPSTPLMPLDPKGQAELWRWMSWGMCHWGPALRPMMHERMVKPLILHQPPDEDVLQRAEAAFHPLARLLEEHLRHRPFLLGETLTLADLALGVQLVYSDMAKIPLGPYAKIQSWYAGMAALPAWHKAMTRMQVPT